MAFYEWLLARLAPPNRGDRGSALVRVIAGRIDDAVARLRLAAKADLPSEAPDDALPYVGGDRMIERLPGEPLDAYRARLTAAWETWSWACARRGLWHSLYLVGLRGVTFMTAFESRWDRFCPTPLWARFRVVSTGRASWGETTWGAFNWGALAPDAVQPLRWGAFRWGSRVWGLDAPETFVTGMKAQLRKWKSSRDRVHSVSFTFGGPVWGQFLWGSATWSAEWPVTITQPQQWGSVVWGDFTWGVPEQLL